MSLEGGREGGDGIEGGEGREGGEGGRLGMTVITYNTLF